MIGSAFWELGEAEWEASEVSVFASSSRNARNDPSGRTSAGLEWTCSDSLCGADESDIARVDRAVVVATWSMAHDVEHLWRHIQ